MKNYYDFTKLTNDKDSINYYSSLSNNILNSILDNSFNNIDYHLNYYAKTLKQIFNGSDYNEHYYLLKSLSEELNDIKIILNILGTRNDD